MLKKIVTLTLTLALLCMVLPFSTFAYDASSFIVNSGTVNFDATTKVLTLENANVTGGIALTETSPVTVNVVGTNIINNAGGVGLLTAGNMVINAFGASLDVTGTTGIQVNGNLQINSGAVKAYGTVEAGHGVFGAVTLGANGTTSDATLRAENIFNGTFVGPSREHSGSGVYGSIAVYPGTNATAVSFHGRGVSTGINLYGGTATAVSYNFYAVGGSVFVNPGDAKTSALYMFGNNTTTSNNPTILGAIDAAAGAKVDHGTWSSTTEFHPDNHVTGKTTGLDYNLTDVDTVYKPNTYIKVYFDSNPDTGGTTPPTTPSVSITTNPIQKEYDGKPLEDGKITGSVTINGVPTPGTFEFVPGQNITDATGQVDRDVIFTPNGSTTTYPTTVKVTITKRPAEIGVQLDKTTLKVGETLPTASLYYKNVISGDNLKPSTANPTYSGHAPNNVTVGGYTVKWENLDPTMKIAILAMPDAKNYDISFVPTANYTITGADTTNPDDGSSSSSNPDASSSSTTTTPPIVIPPVSSSTPTVTTSSSTPASTASSSSAATSSSSGTTLPGTDDSDDSDSITSATSSSAANSGSSSGIIPGVDGDEDTSGATGSTGDSDGNGGTGGPGVQVTPEGGLDIDTNRPGVVPNDVKINGASIDPSQYTVEDGIVSILPTLIASLSDGEHEFEILYDDGSVGGTVITDQGLPLGAFVEETGGAWSLFDLLMTVLAFVLMIVYFVRRKKDKDREEKENGTVQEEQHFTKRKKLLVVSTLLFIFAIVLLIITQDFTQPMIFFDIWSIVFAIVGIAQIVVGAFLFRKDSSDGQHEMAHEEAESGQARPVENDSSLIYHASTKS